MFSSLRASSKKRDSDGISASSGASRSSDAKGRTTSFSLSRLLPLRRRSKSRTSLDSELSRSDNGGVCSGLGSSPFPGGGAASRNSPPLPLSSVVYLSHSYSSMGAQGGREQGEGQTNSDGVLSSPADVPKDGPSESASSELAPSSVDRKVEMIECPVCLMEKAKSCFLEISTCHHRCCSKCLKEYFKIEIMESRVAIACPECSELFHPNDIEAIVQDAGLMHKYQDFMLRRVLAMDSDTRWCPAPDCGYAVIATGCAGCPKLKCERVGCDTYFCYHCKQYWHPNQTCDAARAERSPNIRSASVSYSQESGHQNEIKSCPRCGAFIVKMDDGSCNHMTCAVCGAGFCWLCMQEISDLHYLSPSGCTFWGRKPWSRKKKILWQLGTLVGAPVGITLVAGIAVPAMIIGIPVWVGRKIHFRYDKASRHKRNLAITGGVAASILAAPVVAGLAVGIGVPILLAYVYGVVPISLCRSGGCGVTTTNTGGVRFDFDEENENNTQGPYSLAGDNHSLETAPNVANPSIAPSIGDASLGMTNSLSASGSHMERAGVLRDDSDRDSSSHRAIAGNSINGSLCSATYSAQHHKLEVRADVSEHTGQCERSSVGGESYNVSLTDDASTRALAGSIISPKDKDGISLCSRHFEAPLVYPEESGKEGEGEAYGGSGGGRGSSSCPTSPHLRKASPAPSEEARSGRSKKCTRFMDQVSEIESRGDCVSLGSVLSTHSESSSSGGSPSCEGVVATVTVTSSVVGGGGACSSLSLAVSPSEEDEEKEEIGGGAAAALASCESLLSEGRAANGAIRRTTSLGNGCGVKAESTSVLLDGADSRRCEMGGARRKSERMYRDELSSVGRPFMGPHKKGGGPRDKEHRSQPGNLSDISEMKGMPALHTAACSDLLAVVDASCDNVFLDRPAHTTARIPSSSSSSSSSSSDQPTDSHPHGVQRRASSPGEPTSASSSREPLYPALTRPDSHSNDGHTCTRDDAFVSASSCDVSVSDMKIDLLDGPDGHLSPPPAPEAASVLATSSEDNTGPCGAEVTAGEFVGGASVRLCQLSALVHEASAAGPTDTAQAGARDWCFSRRTNIGQVSARPAVPDVERPVSQPGPVAVETDASRVTSAPTPSDRPGSQNCVGRSNSLNASTVAAKRTNCRTNCHSRPPCQHPHTDPHTAPHTATHTDPHTDPHISLPVAQGLPPTTHTTNISFSPSDQEHWPSDTEEM
ncbi:E3 ubiquitin-protein ligase RNF19A [Aplysia californica]|uniref:RBR-type E3 ubiquitin transferase n=1 Tax=Aplysia californica TaxID=6500 RepID=A0ABM1AEQ4_APLCA|nr:E3 ubiquitin-protein ligase RNF19A [Aplysia californica]